MYNIILGRSQKDREKYGEKGTILLGKHYVKMGQTESLSNKILMDMARTHVMFICGKRGGGKSYTMGVLAEGMASMDKDISQNLSIVLFDTMGIYWTMKFPNHKDEKLLAEWEIEPKALEIKIYTPKGFYDEYKERGIPTDFRFSIKPSELSSADWCITFDVKETENTGILITKVINELKSKEEDYDIPEIIEAIRKEEKSDQKAKDSAENMFKNSMDWGLFDKGGTPISQIIKGGQVTVLDVSCYASTPGGWKIKALVIGLISQKLFEQRMVARKHEEFDDINKAVHYFGEQTNEKKLENPLVWLVIDEAHELLPKDEVTLATGPLVTILREGRQPGISLVLASQQPGKIHTDVMTQSDIILSHRITAKIDVDALGKLMQTYMRGSLEKYIDQLPRVDGSAIVLDDSNERIYPMRVRPRFTWHGGEAPDAMMEQKREL